MKGQRLPSFAVDEVYTLRSQLRELQRRSREREEDTEASETSRPQPEANGGARWLVVDADSVTCLKTMDLVFAFSFLLKKWLRHIDRRIRCFKLHQASEVQLTAEESDQFASAL